MRKITVKMEKHVGILNEVYRMYINNRKSKICIPVNLQLIK